MPDGDVHLFGLAIHDIKGGKIAAMKVDGAAFTVNDAEQAGKPDKITGEIVKLHRYDFDATAHRRHPRSAEGQ